jgi:hypothetical protein
LKSPLLAESLTRRAGWESQQDQAARAEKKKIFDALALASILHNSALESASKVVCLFSILIQTERKKERKKERLFIFFRTYNMNLHAQ